MPRSQLQEIVIPVGKLQLSGLIGHPQYPKASGLRSVILVHGFAAEKRENGLFAFLADTLVQRGYTVLLYDWRGLGESHGTFVETDLKRHASDFRDVAKWFSRECGIKSENTCALGFSLGAALVALSLNRMDPFGGLAFLSPALRPSLSMWPRYNTQDINEELQTQGYILKNDIKVGRRMIDSLRTTDLGNRCLNLRIPIFVCHGTADTRIPISATREAFSRAEHSPVYFAEFENASHSFRPDSKYWEVLAKELTTWLGSEGLQKTKMQKSISADAPRQDQPKVRANAYRRPRFQSAVETSLSVAA